MKKKIIIFSLMVILIFSFGAVAGATGNWISTLVASSLNNVNSQINDSIDPQLANLQTKVQDEIAGELTKVVDAQSKRATDEIQAYYDSKVNDIAKSSNFNTAAQEIVVNTTNLIKQKKSEIDNAFADMFGQ